MKQTRITYETVELANGKGFGVDTFSIDRKAWTLAKNQLSPNASLSSIALLAQEIKESLTCELYKSCLKSLTENELGKHSS